MEICSSVARVTKEHKLNIYQKFKLKKKQNKTDKIGSIFYIFIFLNKMKDDTNTIKKDDTSLDNFIFKIK